MREFIIILFCSVITSLGAHAAIYKFIDEQGNVTFSDQPGPNAEVIEERTTQPIGSSREGRPILKLKDPTKSQWKKVRTGYDELRITSPVNEQDFRANDGDINVDIDIQPPLREKLGHKLILLLDGKPVAEPGPATSFALHNIFRGQHTLVAKVIDKNGNTIETAETVTVFLKRFSKLHQKPAVFPPKPKLPTP